MNYRIIARLLALGAFVAALVLTISIRQSPTHPNEWTLSLNLEIVNTSLFILAVLVFWFSSRLPKSADAKSDDANED